MSYMPLTSFDLVLAASLLLINAALSWRFGLGLERSLLIAGLRMVAQLALAGLILRWLLFTTSPALTVLAALIMVAVAGAEALSRQNRRIKGPRAYGLGAGTLLFAGLSATIFAVAGVIGADPWWAPRYILPILGMVLGNALTGVSLVLDTITDGAMRDRAAIEARLALGATRFEAMDGVLQRAMKTGLMPILNAMAATGIVSLPGMMTGQILAGADPLDAAKYQIMIMFIISGATALAVAIAGIGAIFLITDERHRLRLDRLT